MSLRDPQHLINRFRGFFSDWRSPHPGFQRRSNCRAKLQRFLHKRRQGLRGRVPPSKQISRPGRADHLRASQKLDEPFPLLERSGCPTERVLRVDEVNRKASPDVEKPGPGAVQSPGILCCRLHKNGECRNLFALAYRLAHGDALGCAILRPRAVPYFAATPCARAARSVSACPAEEAGGMPSKRPRPCDLEDTLAYRPMSR